MAKPSLSSAGCYILSHISEGVPTGEASGGSGGRGGGGGGGGGKEEDEVIGKGCVSRKPESLLLVAYSAIVQ